MIPDVATKSPQSVSVPRRYVVRNEIKPSRFYETRGEVGDHVKSGKEKVYCRDSQGSSVQVNATVSGLKR